MKVIAHQELTSSAASITFSSIPQTGYTDLVLVMSVRNSTGSRGSGGHVFRLDFNNSSANFTNRVLYGTGSSVGSDTGFYIYAGASDDTAGTFGSTQITIPNYTSSLAKSVSSDGVGENNATTAHQGITATLWNVTDPITTIKIYPTILGGIAQYSSATLYGILAGSDGSTTVA